MDHISQFVGVAGWSIPTSLRARFSERGSHLERYAQALNAVEINSSFYRPHQLKTYQRWAACTPEHFRFSVKLPRTITHQRRLVDFEALLDRFSGEAAGLGQKLGVVLVQLPPSLIFDSPVAKNFFVSLTAAIPASIACEPRHPSWFTAEANHLLTALEVARVATDPHPIAGSEQPGGSISLVYYRLHGSPRMYYSKYEAAELINVRQKLDRAVSSGRAVWCIFDNTAQFAALPNALDLAGMNAVGLR